MLDKYRLHDFMNKYPNNLLGECDNALFAYSIYNFIYFRFVGFHLNIDN